MRNNIRKNIYWFIIFQFRNEADHYWETSKLLIEVRFSIILLLGFYIVLLLIFQIKNEIYPENANIYIYNLKVLLLKKKKLNMWQ